MKRETTAAKCHSSVITHKSHRRGVVTGLSMQGFSKANIDFTASLLECLEERFLFRTPFL